MLPGVVDLSLEPRELGCGGGRVGLAGAGCIANGEEDVVQDDEARVGHGGERNVIVAASGEIAEGGVAICLREIPRERFGNHSCGEGEEEHTSELQSLRHLVCRLLLE